VRCQKICERVASAGLLRGRSAIFDRPLQLERCESPHHAIRSAGCPRRAHRMATYDVVSNCVLRGHAIGGRRRGDRLKIRTQPDNIRTFNAITPDVAPHAQSVRSRDLSAVGARRRGVVCHGHGVRHGPCSNHGATSRRPRSCGAPRIHQSPLNRRTRCRHGRVVPVAVIVTPYN
jgi:hypothetical protein